MRESDKAGGRRMRRRAGSRGLLTITAISGAACLFIAACQSGAPAASAPKATSTKAAPAAASAQLAITPSNGQHNVDPSAGVKVTASGGKIQAVTVTAGHAAVSGSLNGAHTVWQSTWALAPSSDYTLHARAVNSAGKTITSTSSFRTLTPSVTDTAQIFEGYQQTYGVGMPILLKFSSPVTNKAAVEKSLEVTTSRPVTGAWYWDGNQTLYFRPMNYWPANTTVSFDGHLNGVAASSGVYFTADLTQTFDIGQSLIVVASTKTHYMNVYYKGSLLGHWAISTGRPGLDTTNGTFVTIEKGNPTRMVGNGYNELVPYAVRFTFSGDYIHDAWWSVAQQGITNVSHGCVNVSPAHSQVYYNLAVPGDPVTVTGSPAAGKWDDGWTVWFLTWQQLLKGSALGEAVQAGPSGSTFVSPSAVTETVQTSRLAGPKPNNFAAQ
ncbi:MAG TPA: Ig-like domain-containing protein [Streptosporangiaceae bacterium]|nr:Ig-like domain-containing protein [Streptosporangiaceae bacterium]